MRQTLLKLASVLVLATASFGCDDDPPNPGFRISTYLETINPITGLPTTVPHRYIDIAGALVVRGDDATGTRTEFGIESSREDARVDVENGVAPALWNLGEYNGPCAGQTVLESLTPGEDEGIFCSEIPSNFYFIVDPNYIDADYPPASVAIHGNSMSAEGGMPWVEYWNSSGQYITSAQASDVAPDGTWLRGPTPDLSQATSGQYLLKIKNSTGEYVGSAIVEVFKYQEPPPPPNPDPCYCPPDEPCMPCEVTYYMPRTPRYRLRGTDKSEPPAVAGG